MAPPAPQKWIFGFEYWEQREHFGLKDCQSTWYVSLLERLREMCKLELEEITANPAKGSSRAYRYHAIDWNKKNVPITREDLSRIPKDADGNDYEIYQFTISMSLGRIIGFIDDNRVFQIVLLDPKHNLQPSRDYNYAVDRTEIGRCHFTSFTQQVIETANGEGDELVRARMVEVITAATHHHTGGSILLPVSEATRDSYQEMLSSGLVTSGEELLNYAIETLKSDKK